MFRKHLDNEYIYSHKRNLEVICYEYYVDKVKIETR